MRWAQKQRIAFIGQRLRAGACVNRSDIMKEFDVSLPQASVDINAFNKAHPGAMKYDRTRKAYVADCLTLAPELHGLDTERQVFFYERDFYVLSNFSAFRVVWRDIRFDTSEAAYHWAKFMPDDPGIASMIRAAPSAHVAFKLAEHHRSARRSDWDDIKVDIMRDILRAKVQQHEYVHRKLLATGHRELIEDSWRDGFWGWGPNRDGQNMLGKLWMEIRAELRNAQSVAA